MRSAAHGGERRLAGRSRHPQSAGNIHLHGLVLDGVYCTTGEGVPVFHAAPAPTGEKLQALLGKILTRILRLLTREEYLVEEEGVTYVADAHGIIDPDNLLAPLQAASCTYRIALGPRAGRKVLSLQTAARAAPMTQPLCANAHGFSLHAGVRCEAEQRSELEHRCRYITRPAIANERLSMNHAGQVVLKLKTPYRDGTSHIVMSPLEFMQRLAALVPRPRLHLIRFHGVLAPHAKLRAVIV
ncbi:MAG: transposase, partial [Pseudomonadota bacterium]